MKHIIITLFSITLLGSCTPAMKYDKKVSDILRELDEAIVQKAEYEKIKEQRIDGIKGLLRTATSPGYVYSVYDNLFDEYSNYNLDSAMVYAGKKRKLANEQGDANLKNDAMLDVADIYLMTGMYVETKELMQTIEVATLDSSLLPHYYNVYHKLYREMAVISISPDLKKEYEEKGALYHEEMYEALSDNDITKLFIKAELKRKDGKHNEVVELLGTHLGREDISVHDKAVLAYIIARSYQRMEQADSAIYYFALSSIYDIRTPVHEHAALYKLSSLLYEQGDMERAYRYINSSISDALKVNARANIYYINQRLPLISQSYNAQMRQQQNKLIALVAGISLLMVLLAVFIVVVYRSLKRISAAKREQNRTNAELEKVNAKLVGVNNTLLESNNIKEAYMGRYLDLCSNYINGVEEYRTHLNNILRKDGGAEVLKTIKTSTYLKEELEEFYSNFDVTFLHIFPDFVEQFNNLLQEDKRITLKQGELLNTELRVFALIRLGITDSIKIAGFLRRSTSTIYNYRVKMRNAAINERQDFEKQVINIGSV